MATCPNWAPASTALYWLQGSDDLYRLNGVSPPIHEANKKSNQRITEADALAMAANLARIHEAEATGAGVVDIRF